MNIFEELDYQQTPLGDISLRRRSEPRLDDRIVYEVKLGDEFLMSSLFTCAEVELAQLGLAPLHGNELDVVVGGLGLGYTSAAVLDNPAVGALTVIEVMAPVIDWHRRHLVPLGEQLCADPRCRLLEADFFAWTAADTGTCGAAMPAHPVDAVLLDIDHSPTHWLNPGHCAFYTDTGLRCLASKIRPGGMFGLWSNDPPDAEFMRMLGAVFASTEARVISFPNPYSGGESTATVYLATTPD